MKFFKRIIDVLHPDQNRKIPILLVFMLIATLLEMLSIGLIIPLLSFLSDPGSIDIFYKIAIFEYFVELPADKLAGLIAALIFSAYLIKFFYMIYLTHKLSEFIYSIKASLSQRLFKSYLYKPYIYHTQSNSSIMIRNATIEVGQFAHIIRSLMSLITELFVILGLTSMLLFVEPVGTLVIIFIIGGFLWIFQRFSRNKLLLWGEERQYYEGRRIKLLQQGLGGIKNIKLMHREREFIRQYSVDNLLGAKAEKNNFVIQQIPRFYIELLVITSVILLIFIAILGEKNIQEVISVIGVFALVAIRIIPSSNRILTSIQVLRFGSTVVDTIHNEIGALVKVNSNLSEKNDKYNHTPFQSLRIEKISYCYPEGCNYNVLKDLSLHIEKGKIYGIIGGSGSGKSTLIDIMLGLIEAKEGGVYINDIAINKNLKFWQNKIGYVAQSIYISDESIRNNIAFGVKESDICEKSILNAVSAAMIQEFVESLPNGLDTILGEHGVRLSGGQLQRIGIARALYNNPEVLVLDEATSALDEHTENDVMKSIFSLQGEKTIIIVTHRLTTISRCDKVFRINNGVIVDSGSYDKVVHNYKIKGPDSE
jgi:ATP-binding cassette, subfamily B, bacterial PglK